MLTFSLRLWRVLYFFLAYDVICTYPMLELFSPIPRISDLPISLNIPFLRWVTFSYNLFSKIIMYGVFADTAFFSFIRNFPLLLHIIFLCTKMTLRINETEKNY